MITVQTIWFGVIAVFLVGYTVLAGIDLGLGVLMIFARNDQERKTLFGGISPFWDGNQVWLIAVGALLFTVFPPVYALVFSSFYPFVLLALFALIVRAVSIEIGIRSTDERSRRYWGIAVAVGGATAVFLFGVIFGNILRGLPLDMHGAYTGTYRGLLNSFALLTGGVNLAMLTVHGATYLAWKADGKVVERARQWVRGAWMLFVLFLLTTFVFAVVSHPHLTRNYRAIPALWLLPSLGIVAVLALGLWNKLAYRKIAFFTSASAIMLLLGAVVVGLFPTLVPARGNLTQSLAIANTASSSTSLIAMLIITGITMPLVILATIWSYRLFGGKISTEQHY